MRDDDLGDVVDLARQLGYDVDEVTVSRGVQAAAGAGSFLAVAQIDEAVVGWIHATVRHVLEEGAFGEIEGLVVDVSRRARGIGKALVSAAERWAIEQGMTRIRVRSRLERAGAHAFYERLGYRRIKAQAVFDRELPLGDDVHEGTR